MELRLIWKNKRKSAILMDKKVRARDENDNREDR